jgi:Trypsin-co-occurring domain 2/Coenzyme PQQ synthesis protein D (PqqD)
VVVGDGKGGLPSLADTIVAVRRELSSALAAGEGPLAQFRAGPVELDFAIAVAYAGGGPTGVQLSVLTLGGQGAQAHAEAQRIKVVLQPLDPDTGRDAQATGARQELVAKVPEALDGVGPGSRRPSPGDGAPPECPVRAEGIEVHEVADGLVVYQAQPECVHHLNNTAAIVLELCDGKNTVTEIGGQLAAAFGLTQVPAGVTEACIADLWSKGVIV